MRSPDTWALILKPLMRAFPLQRRGPLIFDLRSNSNTQTVILTFDRPSFQCVSPCRLGPSKGSKPCLLRGSTGPAESLNKTDQSSLRNVVKLCAALCVVEWSFPIIHRCIFQGFVLTKEAPTATSGPAVFIADHAMRQRFTSPFLILLLFRIPPAIYAAPSPL